MEDSGCLSGLNEVLHKSIAPLGPVVLYTDAGREKWGLFGLDCQTEFLWCGMKGWRMPPCGSQPHCPPCNHSLGTRWLFYQRGRHSHSIVQANANTHTNRYLFMLTRSFKMAAGQNKHILRRCHAFRKQCRCAGNYSWGVWSGFRDPLIIQICWNKRPIYQ